MVCMMPKMVMHETSSTFLVSSNKHIMPPATITAKAVLAISLKEFGQQISAISFARLALFALLSLFVKVSHKCRCRKQLASCAVVYYSCCMSFSLL